MSKQWKCYICGHNESKTRHLYIKTCGIIPEHIMYFNPKPTNIILTTVCNECLSIDSNMCDIYGK